MSERLRATRFRDVRRVAETGSTNADVLELGRDGAAEGVVVVADHQRAGRGRRDRGWIAPPGSGLLCSVLLRPPARVADLVTAAVALAGQGAARALGVRGVGIKWPNDLIAVAPAGAPTAERKLAGILAEADWGPTSAISDGFRAPGDHQRVLVAAGIGMNLIAVPGLPTDVAERRVSIEELLGENTAGASVDVDAVLQHYLGALEVRYAQLLDDRGALLRSWRAECVTLGRQVRVDLGSRDLVGRAEGVDDRGRLLVRTAEGTERAVAAGDVVHLRSAG